MRARAWRWLAVLCVAGACAALVAACGDDDDEGGGGGAAATSGGGEGGSAATPAADKPTGEPIKVMTIAAVNWNGPAYPNILETAELYEQYINDRGGVAGRPLDVQICDEMGDPNQLAACGRKAVAEDVVAIPGSFTITGDRIVPILEEADIAWFGICCPVAPAELNSPITFSFGPGEAGIAGFGPKAAEEGCKNISLVLLESPAKTLYINRVETSLKGYGMKLAKVVVAPISVQDYAPQVAQATGGDIDCLIGIIGEQQWASFLGAFAQSGSKARLFGSQGNLDEKVAKDHPDITKDGIVVGYYPNITDPAFDDYREAIEQYKPDPSLDYNSLAGLGTWTAYTAFKKIVEGMEGPITAKAFLEAVRRTDHLDTGGKTPTLDLTAPWGDAAPEGSENLFTRSVAYLIFDDQGKLQTETPGFTDMTEAMFGRKPDLSGGGA